MFKNVVEKRTAKNYHSVSLLSAVSKVFENLVSNRVFDLLEKCGLFLIRCVILDLLDQMQIFGHLGLLMQEYLKAPFLDLHFSYCTFMTFMMVLCVILLSMLMTLFITNVIRHLICRNNYSWLLNVNLIYGTLWTGAGSGLLVSLFEKLNLFCLTGPVTLVLLM